MDDYDLDALLDEEEQFHEEEQVSAACLPCGLSFGPTPQFSHWR